MLSQREQALKLMSQHMLSQQDINDKDQDTRA